MAQSAFDVNAFLETSFKGNLDTTYVLPPEAEYPAQITDKIDYNAGTIGEGKNRAGETWANVTLYWELHDEKVKQLLNTDRVVVRQSIMLDLLPGSTPQQPMLDFGTNKNMRLKRTLEATGLNKQKNFTLNALKHQMGTVKVEHRRVEGFDDDIAEVVRVAAYNGHG